MTGPRSGSVTVRVPATSANLGPGFDALALALGRYDVVRVDVVAGGLAVEVDGAGAATLPRNERHLVVRALRAAFDRLGGQPSGLALRCENRIPQSRGLGSSAAAIVAGVVAARALASGTTGDPVEDEAADLDLAAELEGHPDNVAGCLAGGLTIAWRDDSGVRSARAAAVVGVAPAVFLPPTTAATAEVRGLLPATVPHLDAAANAGRAALLIAALTGRPDLLMPATEDRLHQRYRAAAMPATAELVARLRAAGVPATVSGAGPAVLALVAPAATAELATYLPVAWSLLTPGMDVAGAMVLHRAG